MQRIQLTPRPDWQAKIEALGMNYHTIDDVVYWDESACYRFSEAQIDQLEDVSNELHQRCLQAVEHVIEQQRYAELGISPALIETIQHSWQAGEPSIYGRFDLAWSGQGDPKLLEYNADTPTALLEASVVQWFWLQDCFPQADQFNSIHERLITRWQQCAQNWAKGLHFTCVSEHPEDLGNLDYLRDTAVQAGLDCRHVFIEDIGWDSDRQRFVDFLNQPILNVFKLYPWEWLVRDEFGSLLLNSPVKVIEPAWKILLSSKGLLPILWELFPNHPNLLAACFEGQTPPERYVRKPLFSREGSNIELHNGEHVISSGGRYGEEGHIYQAFVDLPVFDQQYPIIGSWMIGDQAAGIGIREDTSPITSNLSRFIPHYF